MSERNVIERRLKIAQFLEYNRDEVFKNLLAVEEHLRFAKPGTTSSEAACIIKHLAEIESHCDEAISHASELGYDEEVDYWRQIRDKVRDLRYRIMLEGIQNPTEMIRDVRQIRQILESFNPELSAMGCGVCGAAMQLGENKQEESTKAIPQLPQFIEPNTQNLNRGLDINKTIKMARKGDVLLIYAGEHVGRALIEGAKEIDLVTGRAANPPLERPSTWIALGSAVAFTVIALTGKIKPPWDVFLTIVGGYASTLLWDIGKEVIAGGPILGTPFKSGPTLSGTPKVFILPKAQVVTPQETKPTTSEGGLTPEAI